MEIQYYEHACKCGCDGQIEIKKYHKYYGIPLYIQGHSFRGKKHTEIQREKWSKKRKITLLGKNNPIYGKKQTEEAKQKTSIALKGENNYWYNKNLSFEHRQKLSEANKGKKQPEEVKHKLSLLFSGINNPMYGVHRYGEDSPGWIDGKSFEPYGIEFNKPLKQSILERDNSTCQNPECKIEYSKRLDVHHIDYNKKNNNPENLITLCDSCHAKTNGKKKRQYWTEFYQNIIRNRINL